MMCATVIFLFVIFAAMSESETFNTKSDLGDDLKEITSLLAEAENELFVQKQQRPFNTPYIKSIERRLRFLQINRLHIIDRLNKLDGCF